MTIKCYEHFLKRENFMKKIKKLKKKENKIFRKCSTINIMNILK